MPTRGFATRVRERSMAQRRQRSTAQWRQRSMAQWRQRSGDSEPVGWTRRRPTTDTRHQAPRTLPAKPGSPTNFEQNMTSNGLYLTILSPFSQRLFPKMTGPHRNLRQVAHPAREFSKNLTKHNKATDHPKSLVPPYPPCGVLVGWALCPEGTRAISPGRLHGQWMTNEWMNCPHCTVDVSRTRLIHSFLLTRLWCRVQSWPRSRAEFGS
jgi:hypothetical protein